VTPDSATTGSGPGARIAGLAVLIGSPVAHSLSPVIHRAAFAAAGIDWAYAALDVAPGEGAAAVDAMRVLRLGGMSVTMPHKAHVAAAVDRLDPAARSLQSVNTVSWDGDVLVGASTDGAGFVAALTEIGIDVEGARVAIIGAGGAARSVIDALGRAGTKDITVLNRSEEAAEHAAQLTTAASVGIVSDVTRADIVVNATSVGMGVEVARAGAGDLPCDPALLHRAQIVVDLVYHPLRTAWLCAADERGARTVDGLGMLIHQAALQQQCWLGALPDVAVMRAAAEAALAAR
jgi:shikimate dehydrogenase